jgi:hypothetical protein
MKSILSHKISSIKNSYPFFIKEAQNLFYGSLSQDK